MRVYKVKLDNGDEFVALAEYTYQAERAVRDCVPPDIYVKEVIPIPENYVTQVKYVYVECPRCTAQRKQVLTEKREQEIYDLRLRALLRQKED